MVVLTLVRRSGKELAAVLRGMAAKAEAGELTDMVACVRDPRGGESLVLVGVYRHSAGALSKAGFRCQAMADRVVPGNGQSGFG